jgi:phosphoglycerate kinase
MLLLQDVKLKDQRVLIRLDLNVPLQEGEIVSDARLQAALPTIEHALKAGAQVILMSHLGRPQAGSFNAEASMAPVAQYLAEQLKVVVHLAKDLHDVEASVDHLTLLENVRFNEGEIENDPSLAQHYASLCDIFVMDAFGSAHRTHASTVGVAEYAPQACAGFLLQSELSVLEKALQAAKKPLIAVVGGAKVSSKLSVLHALAKKVDCLIVGGGIANTFIAAAGYEVGASLYEPDLLEQAREIMALTHVPLPTDVVVAKQVTQTAKAITKSIDAVQADELILDLGSASCLQLEAIIAEASMIIWNGPVGVFELEPFAHGTQALAQAVAKSSAFTIAGGGDTIAAIETFDIEDEVDYISTGGGAFLEFIEGKTLPAVKALQR